MVQVDIFWSYALGASFAASAGRQLMDEESTTQNRYFIRNILFLALAFAPSGVVLLWVFTGWETMYYWDRDTLPNWIVPLFTITNVTQGILGFWVAHKLVKAGKLFWAHAQWVFGYLFMLFILVHGWDGQGYRRFFTYTDHQTAEVLDQGFGLWIALKWTISPVALVLYAMGAIMLPILFYYLGNQAKDGFKLGGVDKEKANQTSVGDLIRITLRVIFVYTLGSAIVWSLLIHLLGWGIGTLVFIPVFWFMGIGKSGLIRKGINEITLESDTNQAVPGAVSVPAD